MYIACEDCDFIWTGEELQRFRQLWRDGLHLLDIAKELKRHRNEVLILAVDQADRGYIKTRYGAIFGRDWKKGRRSDERARPRYRLRRYFESEHAQG